MLTAIHRARLDSLRRTQKRITLGWTLLAVATLFHILRAITFYYVGRWQFSVVEVALVAAYLLNCLLFRQGYTGYFVTGMVVAAQLPLLQPALPATALSMAAIVVLVQFGLVYRSYHPTTLEV